MIRGGKTAIKGWEVGKKEKHYIELEYPTSGFGLTSTVKVDGKVFQKKQKWTGGAADFSFTIGEQEKLNIEIKKKGFGQYGEPVLYVNGVPQEARVKEGTPAWVFFIITFFIMLWFLLYMWLIVIPTL